MSSADGDKVAPTGGGQVQDQRVTDLLRWSAGISGPLALAVLMSLFGLMVTLRDEQRDLKIRVTMIAESDKKQDQKDESTDKRNNDQDLQIFRMADQIKELQRRMGMR